MGIIQHDAIIVTGTGTDISKMYTMAKQRIPGKYISNLSQPLTNQLQSFMIFPDGSKEGWEDSINVHERRLAFLRSVEEAKSDGSVWDITVVCITYGNCGMAIGKTFMPDIDHYRVSQTYNSGEYSPKEGELR